MHTIVFSLVINNFRVKFTDVSEGTKWAKNQISFVKALEQIAACRINENTAGDWLKENKRFTTFESNSQYIFNIPFMLGRFYLTYTY